MKTLAVLVNLKNRFRALPLSRQLMIGAGLLFLLLIFSAQARYAAGNLFSHIRDTFVDQGIESKKTEAAAHEEKADQIRDDRLRNEGAIARGQEEAEAAAAESSRTLSTLNESKRSYEKSKMVGRRTDVGLDERERDVLATDQELYPDAQR